MCPTRVTPRPAAILAARLHNQWLARPGAATAAAVVERLCAVQSQDFIGAKWAVGVRATGLDDAAVASAFDRGEILRTHVLRPTWHFLHPDDARWIMEVSAERVYGASRTYIRRTGLEGETGARGLAIVAASLDGGHRTRAELSTALEAASQ